MLTENLLDLVTVESSNKIVKIYNTNLLSPLTFTTSKEVMELPSSQMIKVPLINDVELIPFHFDLLLLQLLRNSRRCLTFDVLNDNPNNMKGFIRKAIQGTEGIIERYRKVAVLGKNLDGIRQPFSQLLRIFEYVEFIEIAFLAEEIVILPLDVKCGSLIMQEGKNPKYGMVLYEEYIKKFHFYTDSDLQKLMSQIITDLDTGEL